MSLLIVTRGLPGSGKTTRARSWVSEDPRNRARVNRDDLRVMLHSMRQSKMAECENAVTISQYAMIRDLLLEGYDIVSDNTYLDDDILYDAQCMAEDTESRFEVWDMRDVSPDICIQRDADRGCLVGSEVILDMHRRHITR